MREQRKTDKKVAAYCGDIPDDMARAWRNAGKQELMDAGWRAP